MSTETQVLGKLQGDVEAALRRLGDDSPWASTLPVLAEELAAGQPFFFRFDLASSSKSISEAPVVSS